MRTPNARMPAIGAVLLSIAGSLAGAVSADVSRYAPGYGGIVFTRLPKASAGEGGRLVLLAKDGSTRVLTPDFESAADPAISFDGKRILFAARRTARDRWDIFEMGVDGSAIRQVTRDMGNCRTPAYQSALFYLNDEHPAYQITFVSDLAGELAGARPKTDLYSVRFDGSGLRRLTYGISSSYDPFQMQDGRILFSSGAADGRTDLFAVHLDGTDFAAFSGPQGRHTKHAACVTPKGKVVFVESAGAAADGSGSLGMISTRRNLHSYQPLTAPADGLFRSPSPLPDGSLLVSRKPAGGGEYAIYRLEPDSGLRTLVFAQPGFESIQAVAVAPWPEPDGHSSVVEDDQNWSKLYCLSVYENDLRGALPRGAARRLRVIEGVPPTAARPGELAKRLLGELDLDEDGSFHLLVPPNTPIQLQILDRDGMALRTSAWIWAKNKENRGCIGCHEDGERTPENVFAQALSHPAAELTLPPARRRTVEFSRDVAPILQAKCGGAACHSADSFGKHIDPGRARTSPLAWAIFGRNTARPWDHVLPRPLPHRMPPPHSAPLTDDERRAILEWIDMGALFQAQRPAPGGQR